MKGQQIAIIGCGNMGRSIIGGLIHRGFDLHSLKGVDTSKNVLAALREQYGIPTTNSIDSSLSEYSAIIIAVKPNQIEQVLKQLSSFLSKEQLVISVAAGISIKYIEKALSSSIPIIRTMPNIAATVGKAVIAFCYNNRVQENHKKLALDILSNIGTPIEIEEKLFDAVTGLSGSGPAFVFMMVEALADAGVLEGIPRSKALSLAIETTLGAAFYLKEKKIHPALARDRITSPGGTTIEGLYQLEEGGFRAAVISAVRSASAKSKEIGKKLNG